MKPTLIYKPYKLKSPKIQRSISNPVLKEIKIDEDVVKSDGQTKPMTLKFSFWHKAAKTHSLYDKQVILKNKEVFAKAQKGNTEVIEQKLPEEVTKNLVYDEKKVGLKTNFWSKASKSVFLSKIDKALGEPYVAKDFTSAKVLRKEVVEKEPMKLKEQFKSNTKTIFLGKIAQ